jgi:energy-coupling factor transport system permease protein
MGRLQFLPGESLVHDLHPLIKLLCCGIFVLLATIVYDPVPNVVLFIVTLVVALGVARLPTRGFPMALLPFTIIALGFGFAQLIFHGEGTLLFAVGPLRITREATSFAVTLAFRMLTIISISLVFSMSTDPKEFVLALIQQLRFSYRVAFGIFFALRMVPQIESELDIIRSAQRVRGIGERGGLIGIVKDYQRFTVPLLVSLIRKTDRAAVAMESKAFGAFPERTYLDRVFVRGKDIWILLVMCALLVAIMVGLWKAGYATHFMLSSSEFLES